MGRIVKKMISEQYLQEHNVRYTEVPRGAILFHQGEKAQYYWQVKAGEIKMVSYSEKGQEFTQGIFQQGESFGEPPLFANLNYPCNAEAMEDSQVYKIPKEDFFNLLKNDFELHLAFTVNLSKRIHYKATIMNEISSYDPEHRILTLIDYLHQDKKNDGMVEVPFTRQQIADMTGLRVETVIRSIKSLEKQGKVKIRNRKVYRYF